MDPRVQRELDLLDGVRAVPPSVRREIQKDTVGMIVAAVIMCVVIGWLAHGY